MDSQFKEKLYQLQIQLLCDKPRRKTISRPALDAIVNASSAIHYVYVCTRGFIMDHRFNIATRKWERHVEIPTHPSFVHVFCMFRTLSNGNIVEVSRYGFYKEIDPSSVDTNTSHPPYFGELEEDAGRVDEDLKLNLKDDWELHESVEAMVHLHDDVYMIFSNAVFTEYYEVDLSTGEVIFNDHDNGPVTTPANERFLYVSAEYCDLGDGTCLMKVERDVTPPHPITFMHVDARPGHMDIINRLSSPFNHVFDHEGEGYALMNDGYLFTVGGRSQHTAASDFVKTNECLKLDVKNNRWITLAPAPITMEQSIIVCLPDGDMFVICYDGNKYLWLIYHTQTDTWSDADDIPDMNHDNIEALVLGR